MVSAYRIAYNAILTLSWLEYLLSVLALSACSVTPITISHLQLLNPVLSVHPPSAIIVQSSFLHTLLEQLADEKEAGLNVVVVSIELGCLELLLMGIE